MNQNNRIPPADRRPQGSVNKLNMNAAGRQNTASKRNKTAQSKSPRIPQSSNSRQVLPNSRIKQNVPATNQKQLKSGKNNAYNKNPKPPLQNSRKGSSVKGKNVKRKPTAEEIALQLQKREAYKRRQAIYKKKLHDYRYRLFKEWLRVFYYRFILFVIMFVFLLLVSIILFFVNLFNNGSPDTGVYTCQTGSIYDVAEIKTVKGNLVFRNGTYYINVTDIASYCEFTITGDVNQIRFISKSKSNDNVRFKIGDAVIYVNGVRVRLTVPVIGEGDGLYVPVEFFEKYAGGISVNINEQERKITVSRTFDEATSVIISEFETENLLKQAKGENQTDVSDFSVEIGYGEISFTLHRDVPTEHIDEYNIGRDLLLITDPEYIAGLKKLAEEAEAQNAQTETKTE